MTGHFHCEFHYYAWALSLWISLLYLGYFIANFIIMTGRFHCEFHYYAWALSLRISLLYPGDFIVNFISMTGRFHCQFHFYTQGISLWISLLCLGAFIAIFIVISGRFHWEFHYSTWALSMRISLLWLGAFIAIFIIISRWFHCKFHYYNCKIYYYTGGISFSVYDVAIRTAKKNYMQSRPTWMQTTVRLLRNHFRGLVSMRNGVVLAMATSTTIDEYSMWYISECWNIPFSFRGFSSIFTWTFLPSRSKLLCDLVNHPLDIVYSRPCTERRTVWRQSPYPPRKGHNDDIEPRWPTLVKYAPVFIRQRLVVERSIIAEPPPGLESNPPPHKGRCEFIDINFGGQVLLLALDPLADLLRTHGSR